MPDLKLEHSMVIRAQGHRADVRLREEAGSSQPHLLSNWSAGHAAGP